MSFGSSSGPCLWSLVGFGGNDLIARTLARAGWKLSARTVGRIRKERRSPEAPEPVAGAGRVLRAKYPNRIWMADVTEFPGLFRLFTFKLAVVFDVFSRMPLAASVQLGKPTAKRMARLLRRAATVASWPRHFVSDHDRAITAIRFRRFLKRQGIRQRFGAVGKTGSIALIERLWRTLKGVLALKLFKPLHLADAKRGVELGLVHYAFFRPHAGLGGATPAEVYFGQTPAHLSAKPPPRGEPGQAVEAPGFQIAFLDPERRLRVLLRKAA
jgi:transposase InsO family protein